MGGVRNTHGKENILEPSGVALLQVGEYY